MSEILFRTMFVLGIIAMIAVLIFAENGPSQPFNPVFPTLDTPFSITNYTYSWTPAERSGEFIDGSATATWVGCSDSPFDRNNCLNTKDGNVSYVEITIPTRIGDFANFTYNWSDISSRSVDGAEITSISITLQCRTTTIGTANLPMTYIANWLGVIPFGRFLPCPISDSFQNVTTTDTFNGTLNDPLPTLQSDGYIYDAALIVPAFVSTLYEDAIVNGTVQISYIEYFVTFTSFGVQICQAPPGALFPQLDIFYCQASLAVTLLIEGAKTAVEIFIFIGQHIANAVAVIAWLYAIPGVPAEIQVPLDIIWTLWLFIIGIEVFRLLKPFGE